MTDPQSPDPTLGKLVTIRELATMAGWGVKRMRRHIMRLNAELHGMLLISRVTPGGRKYHVVSLDKLKETSPQWVARASQTWSRVDEVEKTVDEQEGMLQTLVTAIRDLAERVTRLERMATA